MRPLVVALVVVALAGCGTSGTLDPGVVADLRVAVPATMDAMGIPADARPSARATMDQVNLLALQVDLGRVADLRAGVYDEARLRADAADLDDWLDRCRRERGGFVGEPPRMLTFLRGRDGLTPEERVLMHALIRQGRRESGWRRVER